VSLCVRVVRLQVAPVQRRLVQVAPTVSKKLSEPKVFLHSVLLIASL
jgi:hypothetical protein